MTCGKETIFMKSLSKILDRGGNNFDLIRLAAALAVMLGHSYGIAGIEYEPSLAFTHRETSSGLAVYAFFLISGILVSASFAKQSSLIRFLGLRALRIWPGAIVCALFIALVVGPVFNSLSVAAYFSTSQVSHWLIRNAFLIGEIGGTLPGVFPDNRFKFMVNPTVWTLPVELGCYLVAMVAGMLGAIGSKRGMVIFIGLAGIAFAYFAMHPPGHVMLKNFFVIMLMYSFYPVPFFLLGMLLYGFREKVPLHWLPAVLLLGAYTLFRFTPAGGILLYPAFAYGVLWVASAQSLRRLQPKHDYSYGIYLYGFVSQQMVASMCPKLNNYVSLLVAILIAVGLAALSWHFVERPCLSLLRRKASAPAGVPTTTVSTGA